MLLRLTVRYAADVAGLGPLSRYYTASRCAVNGVGVQPWNGQVKVVRRAFGRPRGWIVRLPDSGLPGQAFDRRVLHT